MLSTFTVILAWLVAVRSVSYQSTYNQDDALIALYYAYGAYCDQEELTSWSCKWCEKVSNFQVANNGDGVINGDALQAFIGYDPDFNRIVLSFRGTHNIQDWMDDLDMVLVAYNHTNGSVHEGFYKSWSALLKDGLKAQIQSMFEAYPGSDMLVTGHSLGSALAYVASLEFKANTKAWGSYNKGAIHLITFGSPRWCDKTLATYFDSVIDSNYRVVHLNDVIPTAPYESFGYHHTAIEVRYTSASPLVYTECDGSGEDPNCNYFGYSVEDHLNYLGLYEDCSATNSTTSTTTTSTTRVILEEPNAHECMQAMDNSTVVALCIAVSIGWSLAFICCCCFVKARHDLKKAQAQRQYVALNEV